MHLRFCIYLLLSLLLVPVVAQEAPTTIRNNPFGVVEGFWFPEQTCELGVGWERIIFDWSQHQPNAPDEWHTLNVDDRWVKNASGCNREIVALLKHTPAWATEGTPGVGVPSGLYLEINDPENYWAGFVRRATDYYRSRGVSHFIIWNEPDISSDTYGYEFEGDLDDYFQMVKVAYLVAKEVNPAAKIHLAGTTYWHDVNAGRTPYLQRLLERISQDPLAAENNWYFDAVSLHIYFRTETVYDIVHATQEILDEFDLPQQIWITETNAAPTDDPQWLVERPVYQIDLNQQANFVVQSAVSALAGGADRVAVYKLYDQSLPEGGESFGILSPADAAPRPAFYAWKTVTNQFYDVIAATFARTEQLEAVRLEHDNGRGTLVAWARTETPVDIQIQAVQDKAYVMDVYGNLTLVRPSDGYFQTQLRPAKCNDVDGCAVGGDVFILVQPHATYDVFETNGEAASRLSFGEETES